MTSPMLITPSTHPGRILIFVILVPLIVSGFACAKRSRSASLSAGDQRSAHTQPETTNASPERININTAPAEELEALPGIGEGLAQRIIEHRDKYGPFRRAEHLMMVRGISNKRFRRLRELITVE